MMPFRPASARPVQRFSDLTRVTVNDVNTAAVPWPVARVRTVANREMTVLLSLLPGGMTVLPKPGEVWWIERRTTVWTFLYRELAYDGEGAGETIQAVLPDGEWNVPTFANGWVNYGGSFNPAGYRRDSEGWVHLRGLVKSGTVGQTIYTLPEGYRPAYRELFMALSNGSVGRIDVTAAGAVICDVGNNAWISMDGMTFMAAG